MRFLASVCLAVALVIGAPSTFAVKKPETSHLVFVTEYIRELAALENIRDSGEQELKQNPSSTFSNMVHSGTLFQLELGAQIRMLKGMNLKAPYDFIIPSLIAYDQRKTLI
jgi:hypothetical protein